jgi:hypothetical protein
VPVTALSHSRRARAPIPGPAARPAAGARPTFDSEAAPGPNCDRRSGNIMKICERTWIFKVSNFLGSCHLRPRGRARKWATLARRRSAAFVVDLLSRALSHRCFAHVLMLSCTALTTTRTDTIRRFRGRNQAQETEKLNAQNPTGDAKFQRRIHASGRFAPC